MLKQPWATVQSFCRNDRQLKGEAGAVAVLPALATRKRSYPVLGWLSVMAVLVVLGRVAFDPTIVGEMLLGRTPVFNALLPGYTNTDRMAELGVDDATMGPKIPAGRLGDPAEFAALAAFLASRRASYITGQAIAVDGGLLQSI